MQTIWAITRHTIMMTMRKRAGLVMLLFLLIGMPVISLFAQGDNTLIGLLRLVINYNFTIMSALLMFMILYLAATVLDSELANKHILMLDVKPVPRWQILMGKWLGLTLVVGWFILLMGLVTYIIIIAFSVLGRLAHEALVPTAGIVAGFVFGGMLLQTLLLKRLEKPWLRSAILLLWIGAGLLVSGQYLAHAARKIIHSHNTGQLTGRLRYPPAQINKMHRQLLVARHAYFPRRPDLDRLVKHRLKLMIERGLLPPGSKDNGQVRKLVQADINKNVWTIPYGGRMTFYFDNLPTANERNTEITVHAKLYGRRGQESGGWLTHLWQIYSPGRQLYRPPPQRSRSGKVTEFHLDANVISPDGKLAIDIFNASGAEGKTGPAQITVPMDDGLLIYIPTGSFFANFLRGLALLWIRMGMLIAIGIAASTYLRGSVAAFLLLGLIAVGSMNSFVYKKVTQKKTGRQAVAERSHTHGGHEDFLSMTTEKLGYVLPTLLWLLPNFDDTDPVVYLSEGREISFWKLLRQLSTDIGLRAGVMVLLGIIAFEKREVGLPLSQ